MTKKYAVFNGGDKPEIVEGESMTKTGPEGDSFLKIKQGKKIRTFKPHEWTGATDTQEKEKKR